jgi:hypothetical protein
MILHCNSVGDLYTIPHITSATAHALVAASSSLWHRHLGHPAPAAITSLRKHNLISCNKVDRSLCHSCQLGKHARLPFSTSLRHFLPLRLFTVMFGPLRWLVFLVVLII